MYKVVVNKLVLKEGGQQFLDCFYDITTDFFLLLLVGDDDGQTKRAFFEKGRTTGEYTVYLSKNNTRVLYERAFEFSSNAIQLRLSFILVKNAMDKVMNLAKIQQLITSKNSKGKCYELLSCHLSNHLLFKNQSTMINLENKILEMKITVKKM